MKTLKNFFRIDFSEHRDWLLGFTKGHQLHEDEVEELVRILNENDPVESTRGQWADHTHCVQVIYTGLNHSDLPTHPLYERVVGIQLCDETRVYLHLDRRN